MNEIMEQAVQSAITGMAHGEGGPFGAAVVLDGRVIATAHNQVLLTHDPTAHAEIQAIRLASSILGRFDLSDCEIYATGQPCPMCWAAIHWAKMKKVYYGTTIEDAAKIDFDDQWMFNILDKTDADSVEFLMVDRERCLDLHKLWISNQDRQQY